MENKFYVYGLTNPLKENEYFYIGKGTGDRCLAHFKEKKVVNPHKTNTIKQILAAGLEVGVVKIKEDLTEDQAYLLEEELIAQYGRKDYDEFGILTNICSSNRPPKLEDLPPEMQEEWRKRHKEGNIRSWQDGTRQFTEAMRDHLKKIHAIGGKAKCEKYGQWNTGLTKETDERLAKFAATKVGTTASDETKAKMSATRKGRVYDAAHRKAISDALKGKKPADVTCPHCGKVGPGNIMKRWHFDRCRTK